MAGPVELFLLFRDHILVAMRHRRRKMGFDKLLVSGFHLRCPGDSIQYRSTIAQPPATRGSLR